MLEVRFHEQVEDDWTYPLIQPRLMEEARGRGYL